MGIKKTELKVWEPTFWTNINDDIEKYITIALHFLIFNKYNQKKG